MPYFTQQCDYNLPTAGALKTEADMYVDMINNTYLNEYLKLEMSIRHEVEAKPNDPE